MMILQNPSSHPLFGHAVPASVCHYWAVQPEIEDKTSGDNNSADKETTADPFSPSTKEETNKEIFKTDPPPFSWKALVSSDFEVQKEGDKYLLATDLPGVKLADLKVEFRDSILHVEAQRRTSSGSKRTIARRFGMEDDVVDVANLSAKLEEGVLTVTVPVKEKDSAQEESTHEVSVPVSTESPPTENNEMNLELDVPGVKRDDLKVTFDQKRGLVIVQGVRNKDCKNSKMIAEAYRLNTHKLDVSRMNAFLMDGVLTLCAPAKAHPIKIVAVNGHLPASNEGEQKDSGNRKTVEDEGEQKDSGNRKTVEDPAKAE